MMLTGVSQGLGEGDVEGMERKLPAGRRMGLPAFLKARRNDPEMLYVCGLIFQ